MQQSNRPGAFSFGNSRDGWISERCLCTGWTWGKSIDTRLTFQTTSTTSYLWKLTFGHTKTIPNSKNKVMNIRHENAPTLMQLKKQLLRHDNVFLMLHIYRSLYVYILESIHPLWPCQHFRFVNGDPHLRHLFSHAGSARSRTGGALSSSRWKWKKTCVAQTWRQVQYKTTVGFGWFESNMSNSMASDSWFMIEQNLTNEKWENTQGNDATIPSPQILIENPDTNHSWRCSTPATATCCCQWTFTNRYNEIISMYTKTNFRYTI